MVYLFWFARRNVPPLIIVKIILQKKSYKAIDKAKKFLYIIGIKELTFILKKRSYIMPIVMKKRVAKRVEFKVSDQKNRVTAIFPNVVLSSMYEVMDCLRQCEVELSKLAKQQGYDSVACLWTYCVVEE